MEIFNTIWTELTTENELLTSFIVIPITFIETAAASPTTSVTLPIVITTCYQVYTIIM